MDITLGIAGLCMSVLGALLKVKGQYDLIKGSKEDGLQHLKRTENSLKFLHNFCSQEGVSQIPDLAEALEDLVADMQRVETECLEISKATSRSMLVRLWNATSTAQVLAGLAQKIDQLLLLFSLQSAFRAEVRGTQNDKKLDAVLQSIASIVDRNNNPIEVAKIVVPISSAEAIHDLEQTRVNMRSPGVAQSERSKNWLSLRERVLGGFVHQTNTRAALPPPPPADKSDSLILSTPSSKSPRRRDTVLKTISVLEALNRDPRPTQSQCVALDQFALTLYGAGKSKDACDVGQADVSLMKGITGSKPDPILASLLHNLSAYLWAEDRPKEALLAVREAISLYRAFWMGHANSDLASCLFNSANIFSSLRRHEEAHVAIIEAIHMYRTLDASTRSSSMTALLARALRDGAEMMTAVSRHEEALAAAKEAVELYREVSYRLRGDDFDALAHISTTLGVYASCLRRVEQYSKAYAATKEALEIVRRLVRKVPRVYDARLAVALRSYALVLRAMGHHEPALKAMDECVDAYDHMRDGLQRHSIARDRGASLLDQSLCFTSLGLHRDALYAARRALEVFNTLTSASIDSRRAGCFEQIYLSARALGDVDEAYEAAGAAMEIRRTAYAARQDFSTTPQLETSLIHLAEALAPLMIHDAVILRLNEERVAINERWYREHGGSKLRLVLSQHSLAVQLAKMGEFDEAWRTYADAARSHKKIQSAGVVSELDQLSRSLLEVAESCTLVKEHRASLAICTEAVGIVERLLSSRPEFGPQWEAATARLKRCEMKCSSPRQQSSRQY